MAAAPGSVTVQKGVAWKTILIIILLIAGLSLLAALPLSFFFNMNMGNWFGNIPLGLIPPIDQPPPLPPEGEWEIPDLPFELPEGWENWTLPDGFELPEGFNGSLPEGDIPWWLIAGALIGAGLINGSLPGGGDIGGLPGMGGNMGGGLGPFGSGSTVVYASTPQPWRYWRIGAYDYYEGATWLITDNSTTAYTPEDTLGTTDYTIIIQNTFSTAGYGTLPLPTLWNAPIIRSGLQVYDLAMQPAVNLTWSLLEDQYGTVHWNATVGIPGTYFIIYDVSFDNTVTVAGIESNVFSQSPLSFVADPPDSYDYLQIPDLSAYPQVVADMQALASDPAIATNDTLETALAVMEYFKTQWYWTPARTLIPGAEFDPGYLINNGYGVSHDFASNYAMYLRSLNISTRLVWGGVGYQDSSPIPAFRKLSHSHFWAEVWIPNATNTGGEWLQIDPSPLPPVMWQPDLSTEPPGPLIQIDPRRADTRVETSHYTMLFTASVAYDVPQNRGTDLFDLTATLTRDGQVITETWLNDPVDYTFADVTDNTILGTTTGAYNNHNFSAAATAGPHRFNASFHAVQNETIVTCNGTTNVNIISLNPNSILRGTGDSFYVDANISDATNDNPIADVELQGYIIEINENLTDNFGQQLTDQNGEVYSSYSFPSSQPEGVYNFTMRFNGTYTVDYPDPYPDVRVTVPGAGSQSQNETITVTATLYINLTNPSSAILPRAHNIEFSGYITFDNFSGIPGEVVTVWMVNSTGTYNICADTTDASGFYQDYSYIPAAYNDVAGNNDVQIWANFTTVYGNATTNTSATYSIRCTNQTITTLNTNLGTYSYVRRGTDPIHVWGSFTDQLGVASTANQDVTIIIFVGNLTNIQLIGNVTTDASGNFDTDVYIPASTLGVYNLSAGFAGTWNFGASSIYVAPSQSIAPWNSSNEVTIVAETALSKDSNPSNTGRNVTPDPIIAGDPVIVSGYLLFENGTGYGGQQVNAWWTWLNGTENFMNSSLTQASGAYTIIYTDTVSPPTNVVIKANYSAGSLMSSYILNATADQDPPVYWGVNISINSLTPNEAIRGQTSVEVTGWLLEKNENYNISNEQIYITFNGMTVRDINSVLVGDLTNDTGFFNTTFVLPTNYPVNIYNVSAQFTNPSYILFDEQGDYLEVNATTQITGMAIDRTGLLNETITVSGRIVDNAGQDITGWVMLWADGSPFSLLSPQLATGSFSWQLDIPDNTTFYGPHNLHIVHNGSAFFYPYTTSNLTWNIPVGGDLAINTIAGLTDFTNLTLNGGAAITITGTLKDTNSSYEIINRLVQVYYNNSLVGSGYTDTNGQYSIEITIPAVAGNTSLIAMFTANGTTYNSQNISIQVIIPPGLGDYLLQYLPWIIGITVGVVVVVVARSLITRRKKEAKAKLSKFRGMDFEAVLHKLEALQHGTRYKEAIIYAYYNFLKLMQNYFDTPKAPSQTARDYAMKVAVKKIKLPPTLIYPFTTLFEDARYGYQPITEDQYKQALQLFLNLNDRILEIPRHIAKEPITD